MNWSLASQLQRHFSQLSWFSSTEHSPSSEAVWQIWSKQSLRIRGMQQLGVDYWCHWTQHHLRWHVTSHSCKLCSEITEEMFRYINTIWRTWLISCLEMAPANLEPASLLRQRVSKIKGVISGGLSSCLFDSWISTSLARDTIYNALIIVPLPLVD